MAKNITRRKAIKLVAAGVVAGGVGRATTGITEQAASIDEAHSSLKPALDNWGNTHNRVWLGGNYWANPMEDWRVADGGAECLSRGGNRSVHSLTHQLRRSEKGFEISVRLRRLEDSENDGGAGIRLGVRSELDDYRSNCFVQNGFDLGVIGNELALGDKRSALATSIGEQELELRLSATPQAGAMSLVLKAVLTESGREIGQLEHLVPADELMGNVALVSNFTILSLPHEGKATYELEGTPQDYGSRYRFSHWVMQGGAFQVSQAQKFGPVLWTMYTLSDSRSDEGFVMKLSAYTGPMGEQDNQVVDLQVQRDGDWRSLGEARLDTDAWLATFRVPNWNEKQDTAFRVIYREKHRDGTETPDVYKGTIKANPAGRSLRMAALTCQNDYAFPYAPVAKNVEKLSPDLVYFSGDQIYETHGGFGVIREPVQTTILNYLRKFYQFGWAFRDVMRNQPTVCLPDDHDVLQGNLWGESGAKMQNPEIDYSASVLGGYIEPVRFVNVVHRTSVNHHPDPYDATPTATGISSYYGDMVYGGVGFAILADRQWKSGPERINVKVGETGQDEEPGFINPAYDPPGLELLGKRQEEFLQQWAEDWRGHSLKAVLSQTVFAGIATHQPLPDRYLKYDFDGSGWPASARNRAVEIMRPSMALHICGDTHLGTLSQYGVDKQRDSNWAFCTPAIAAGWPRWWLPDVVGLPHRHRPSHGLAQTGEYLDSFGNKIYVYAVGNPEVGKSSNRYVKAHEKGSGFGFIIFDTEKLTYTMQAYRFLVDVSDGKSTNQFPGWPVTIHQEENKGANRLG